MSTQVLQGTVILPDRLAERGQIVVEDGLIQDLVEDTGRYSPTLDFGERYIAPGFIDIHTHGIAGADTMDATPDSLRIMARRFAAHGVTGFLPTTVTQSLELTAQAVRAVRDYMTAQERDDTPEAQVLGVHLEGPWISTHFKGAQNERYILPPDEPAVRTLLEAGGGAVKVVTLAPEQPGADETIRLLRMEGVHVSVGHSGATYEQTLRAVDLGATHVTHCFNAMTGLHHRQAGMVGAALLLGDLFAELIADGVHVHPDAMRLLIRAKGRDRVALITDSMSAAELPDGTYSLGGQQVLVRGGEARLEDGTLAGSTLVLDQAVRNLVRLCQIPLPDAISMAAATPAAAIGLDAAKGRIRAGYDADLTILDAELQPAGVFVGGTFCSLAQSTRGA